MTTPEGKVKAHVRKALLTLGSSCYRFMPVQNGMGAPGLDWYCCVNGFFVAIETKVPGKRLTPRQRQTAISVRDVGGIVFVIRSAEDAERMRDYLLLLRNPTTRGKVYDALWEPEDGTSLEPSAGVPGHDT